MAKEKETPVERVYTIPLRKGRSNTPAGKKANRSVNDVKRFVSRHLKTDDVRISTRLNALIWKRGNSKPPARVKVKVSVKEGIATARLSDEIVLEKKKEKKPEPKNKIEELKQKAEEMKAGKDAAKKDIKEDAIKQDEKGSIKDRITGFVKEIEADEDIKEEAKESPVKKVREETVNKNDPVKEKPKKDESNSKA
jgi:large subunit ribosomal protein L31e